MRDDGDNYGEVVDLLVRERAVARDVYPPFTALPTICSQGSKGLLPETSIWPFDDRRILLMGRH